MAHRARPHAWLLAGVAGLALTVAFNAAFATEAAGLPTEKTSQGIAYVSGGVGLEESTALKSARAAYSLAVEVFHAAGGKNEYTAAVPLLITRPDGSVVFDAPTDGPYTLLKLAPGRYVVQATYREQAQRRQVEVVSGGSAKASFVFK
ncbi:MAG: carboxypeptidase regulatory-like domain-containing protein [Rubrivivax sp.]|nr:MAG: carboxypeptidase regulatory-like domain-containing protein [Rubrivivax sp.]